MNVEDGDSSTETESCFPKRVTISSAVIEGSGITASSVHCHFNIHTPQLAQEPPSGDREEMEG